MNYNNKQLQLYSNHKNDKLIQGTRSYLINKLTDALYVKYNNIFFSIGYSKNMIKTEIDNLISEKDLLLSPNELFKPIEIAILDIIRKKFPKKILEAKKAKGSKNINLNENKIFKEKIDNDEDIINNLNNYAQKTNKQIFSRNHSVKSFSNYFTYDKENEFRDLSGLSSNKIKRKNLGQLYNESTKKFKEEQEKMKIKNLLNHENNIESMKNINSYLELKEKEKNLLNKSRNNYSLNNEQNKLTHNYSYDNFILPTNKTTDYNIISNIHYAQPLKYNNLIENKIKKRAQNYELCKQFLNKINENEKKIDNYKFMREWREQQEKKIKEFIEFRNKKYEKILEIKNANNEAVVHHYNAKMKEKEEKEIIRKNLNNEYILFLQDEKNEKMQKLEKQEKYRMILDEQINERKLNQLK